MNIKKIAPIFFDIICILIIVTSNLLVGSPIKYNIFVLNILISIVTLITIIKEKIQINKIDICVIVISLSTFIPLITNQYIRLSGTVEYILKYISVLNIYFITKKYIKKDEKKIAIISNTIIIMSILIILFGIDIMNNITLQKFYKFLGLPPINESSMRMMSLYQYANTLSVFLGFVLFLTIERYLNEQRPKIKSLYVVCMFFQIFAILTTYSRMCWVLLAVLLVIYVLWIKEHRKEIIKALLFSSINAMIYFVLYNYLEDIGKTSYVIISLLVQSAIEYLLYLKLCKIQLSTKMKKIFLGTTTAVLVLIVIGYILIPNNLVLFNSIDSKIKYKRQNIKVEYSTDYSLKIKVKSKTSKSKNISVIIKELNNKEQEVDRHKMQIDNYEGTKEINFKTTDNTDTIEISFNWGKPVEGARLEVEEVTLNDKKIPIYYKLIPIEFINRIEKINANAISLKTRLSYLKQATIIIQNNWLFGNGGNAWKYFDKKDIEENTTAEHSYPMQLFIQNGIVAFIAYGLLIIFLCKSIYKSKNITIKTIGMALLLVVTHSLLDLDMSFFNILIIVYMYIAIVSEITRGTTKTINLNKYIKIVYILLLTVILYFNIGEFITYNIDTEMIKNHEERLKMIDLKIVLSPYNYQYYEDKVNCLSTLKNKSKYKEDSKEYKDMCKKIIDSTSFITYIEKYKDEYMYNKIILNKIELINEENQNDTLNEIKEIWEKEIGADNEDICNDIKKKLTEKLDNEQTRKFIEEL